MKTMQTFSCIALLPLLTACAGNVGMQLPAAPEPKPRALAPAIEFDPSLIEPVTLDYALKVRDKPFGQFKVEITRETIGGRRAIRAAMDGGGASMSMSYEVVFGAQDFTPISSRSEQHHGSTSTVTHLRYENGKIAGTVAAPEPAGGAQTQQISIEVPAGTLLPGMDEYAIWLADLDADKTFTVPLFDERLGRAIELTARVVGEKVLTTPAGEFETWVLETETESGARMICVRKQQPHITVFQQPVGAPVAIELMGIER